MVSTDRIRIRGGGLGDRVVAPALHRHGFAT
jgi:hypothetical protein